MTEGWKTVPMGKLCSISSGESDTQDAVADGPYAFFDRSKITKRSSRFLYDCEALIIPGEGKEFLPKYFKGKFDLHQRAYALFDFLPDLDVRFLYYFLHHRSDYFPSVAVGATVKSLRRRHFDDLPVHIALLPEQQRIVGILDEAFERIATAKANCEKNLQNARALFESHLNTVFAQRSGGWKQKTLEEIATTFGRGKSKHRPRNAPHLYGGQYPFIQTGDIRNAEHIITEYSQTYSVAGLAQSKLWPKETICITIAANIAETAILGFDACFPDSVIGVVANPKEAEVGFIEYLLQSFKMRIQALGKGSAQANINMGTFENERFPFPSVAEQKKIVAKLDELAEETQRLESLYQRKLVALDELKNSLLHQAFSGQLTATFSSSAVVPFPMRLPNTNTTDLHVGILAMAYQHHEQKGNPKHFGHVKAEKIAHMVEAYVGIDLGRQPVKDAAGPNDYPHLKNKVEPRARKAGYFDFQPTAETGGYRVTKLRQFDALIEKTRAALGNHVQAVDKLLDLMLPMNTQQAEVMCTVYAGWNNLLLSGRQPSDEEIVYESRENWHAAKLNIPRQKFFAAIRWMREKYLVPTGKGKSVLAKQSKQ